MKTRTFRASFSLAIGVALFTALSAALPQFAQAQSTDIAVLHSRVDNIDSTLERVDGRLDRMDKRFDRVDERLDRMEGRLVRLEEISIRLDERMNGMQMQDQFIVIPLLLLTLAALIGLLTRGILWGVAREPKASEASRPAPIPPAQPHPS